MDIEEEQEADFNIEFSCQTIDQQYYQVIQAHPSKMLTQTDIKKLIQENHNKKETSIHFKDLRLGFKSKQLRRNFQKVIQVTPGRQEEALRIFDFIVMSENGSSAPLCLHGNTGCGKTSLVNKILDFFQDNFETLKVAYLNCMKSVNVNHVYSGILKNLFGFKEKNPSHHLDKLFSSGSASEGRRYQSTKIIVLDEVDQYMNDQKFIYNLLTWMSLKNSKIVLIFISNVIDLTLRLSVKNQSRLKFENIIFKPYTHQQIQEIIRFKYPDIELHFQKNAIKYVAKKIANYNSDIRMVEKVYDQALSEFQRLSHLYEVDPSNTPKPPELINTEMINILMGEQKNSLLQNYEILINIFNNPIKKTDIQEEVMQKMFMKSKRQPDTQDIILLLCQMQEAGLIEISSNKYLADFTFQNFGIKINESLTLISLDGDSRYS